MRLIIKDYLLQLKEKDELDLLLCDVLLQMGFITDNRPKTGNRQYGVDIRAHNEETLLLCTVKQGDLNRKNWDSDPNSVRQSLNEMRLKHVFTKYLLWSQNILLLDIGITCGQTICSKPPNTLSGFISV